MVAIKKLLLKKEELAPLVRDQNVSRALLQLDVLHVVAEEL